jgi:hypothetical protein
MKFRSQPSDTQNLTPSGQPDIPVQLGCSRGRQEADPSFRPNNEPKHLLMISAIAGAPHLQILKSAGWSNKYINIKN